MHIFIYSNKINEIENQSIILSHINKIENHNISLWHTFYMKKEEREVFLFLLQRLFVLITCCRTKWEKKNKKERIECTEKLNWFSLGLIFYRDSQKRYTSLQIIIHEFPQWYKFSYFTTKFTNLSLFHHF